MKTMQTCRSCNNVFDAEKVINGLCDTCAYGNVKDKNLRIVRVPNEANLARNEKDLLRRKQRALESKRRCQYCVYHTVGECRRFPPVLVSDVFNGGLFPSRDEINTHHSWEYPKVSEDLWCGEFQIMSQETL